MMDLHQSDGQKDRKGSSKKRKNKKDKKSGRHGPSPKHKHADEVDKSKRQKQKQSGEGSRCNSQRERGKKKKSHQQPQQRSPKNSLSDTDDVLAQLQRQRQKKKQTEKAASDGANGQACPRQPLTLGGYRFDPALKRYLPKKAFKPNGNNDVCIQRVKSRQVDDIDITEGTACGRDAPKSLHWGRLLICTASGIQGTYLGATQGQSERKHPVLTILDSLQYCNRRTTRVALTKCLMPKPRVVPIASTIDHIAEHDGTCRKIDYCTPHELTCKETNDRFFSIAQPLPPERRDRRDELRSWGHHLPDDCGCKKSSTTLSTFDVLPSSQRDPRVLPDMITISNNRIFYRSKLQKYVGCRS